MLDPSHKDSGHGQPEREKDGGVREKDGGEREAEGGAIGAVVRDQGGKNKYPCRSIGGRRCMARECEGGREGRKKN